MGSKENTRKLKLIMLFDSDDDECIRKKKSQCTLGSGSPSISWHNFKQEMMKRRARNKELLLKTWERSDCGGQVERILNVDQESRDSEYGQNLELAFDPCHSNI
jgi:hypothetical protein